MVVELDKLDELDELVDLVVVIVCLIEEWMEFDNKMLLMSERMVV